MSHTIHTLTETETACGVTLERVAELLPLVAVLGETAWVPVVGPALAASVARCALGSDVEFVKLAGVASRGAVAVYRKA